MLNYAKKFHQLAQKSSSTTLHLTLNSKVDKQHLSTIHCGKRKVDIFPPVPVLHNNSFAIDLQEFHSS